MMTETSIYEYAKHGLELSADKTALWFYGKSITFRELFDKIDNVADHLYAQGVREGTVVTVHLPNCPQAVMVIYAVAKLGGICNMVHAQTPAAALRENLAFTESDFLITYLPDCTGVAKTALYVDISYHMGLLYRVGFQLGSDDRQMSDAGSDKVPAFDYSAKTALPEQHAFADKCAVYFQSSGTTGTAKIIQMSHGAINRWLENLKDLFCGEVLSDQATLSVAPLYHALGFLIEMHRCISYGAKLVILERWDRQLAADLIRGQAIQFMAGVPSMYLDLLRNPDFNGDAAKNLRHCFVGGDSISWDLIEALDRRVGRRVTFPTYAMTEIGAACALSVKHDKKNSAGYPLKGVKLGVLGEDGALSFCGRGELVICSETMMLGYLKDRQATEAALFKRDGQTWLHTGDYGEIDQDGFVFFIARLKNVIIRKGYCVFPNDVEAIIQTSSFVRDVCVVGIPDAENQTEKVCAAVVLNSDAEETAAREAITEICRRELPPYSVPSGVVFIEQIPCNRMGKIDREALRKQLCSKDLPH